MKINEIKKALERRKFLIHSVHIILNSGVMIFSKSFGDPESSIISKDFLISGLFTAINQLVQETLKDRLQELILQNKKIIFTFREDYFIVLIARFDIDTDFAKDIIEQIDQKFSEKFNLEVFKGRIDKFFNFGPIVDEIIEKNKTEEMKLLEEYEKTFKINIKNIPFKKKQ